MVQPQDMQKEAAPAPAGEAPISKKAEKKNARAAMKDARKAKATEAAVGARFDGCSMEPR